MNHRGDAPISGHTGRGFGVGTQTGGRAGRPYKRVTNEEA
jgi:hypothetical protein